MAVVRASIFPDHKSFVLDVAVSQVALPEGVVLSFGGSLFLEAFFLVFKFFFFRDL